jgi:hypothetical protein
MGYKTQNTTAHGCCTEKNAHRARLQCTMKFSLTITMKRLLDNLCQAALGKR